MEDAGYGLLRIPLPRTPLNKDNKGGGNVLLPAEPHYAAVSRITP
jgi:hypothetical protein